MIANEKYFRAPLQTETYLRARGFDAAGKRTGGIVDFEEVSISAGTVLFRLFADTSRQFGEWWFSPHEMRIVVDYFARSAGPAFAEGRDAGKGILQGVLAVRHEWGGYSPEHLAKFFVVRLRVPLMAYAGEGDDAPDATQTANLKPVRIIGNDGKQRRVRQIFLPKTWEYVGAFLNMGQHHTDTHLPGAVRKHDHGKLYFEPA